MPTAGTHIKFALDVKDKFDIKNLNEYLSGAVYPDSRFITKIDRSCTHVKNQKVIKLSESNSDFEKGWAVHCMCDKLQRAMFGKTFVNILDNLDNTIVHGGEFWVSVTALKMVLDLVVVKTFDIQKYLPMIEYIENANGENIEDIKKYNELVKNTYQDKKEISIEDLEGLLSGLGVKSKSVRKVVEKTEEFLKDEKLVKKVEKVYGEMVGEVLK